MKDMIYIIFYTLFFTIFSVGCEKDGLNQLPLVLEYESCCGSTPVEATVLDTSHIYVPNAFTPNGDGLNDKFRPYFDGDIDYFTQMFIYTMENDTLLYSLDGTLFIGQEDKDFGWDGKKWETLQNEKHKGGFRYEIHFYVQENYKFQMNGIGCSILCDEDAQALKGNESCFYPEQHGEGGLLDRQIPVTESDCFN